MKVEHIIERLEALANWCTPGSERIGPQPINPHVTMREAAEALRRLTADLELVERHPYRRTQPLMTQSEKHLRTTWPHWCVYDTEAHRIVRATSDGRVAAVRALMGQPDSHQVKPIMLVGDAMPNDCVAICEGHEEAAA